MKRIALVVPSILESGGIASVARFVKNAILRSGEFELKVISLSTAARDPCSVCLTRPGSWVRGIAVSQGTWEGLPFTHVGTFASEFEFQRYRGRRILREQVADCDLIQVISGSPAWALSVAHTGKPLAIQVATRSLVERRRKEQLAEGALAWWRWVMTRITDTLDDRAIASAQVVFVENPWMFEYASAIGVSSGTWIRYGPPGVDTDTFKPGASRFGIADGVPPYILSVARFDDPRKNVDLLLEAFTRIAGLRQDADLQLAGATDPGPAFWREVDARGLMGRVRFRWQPSCEELVSLYQNAACFALSSDEEGFGIVLAEAMACGIPVVSTRCGGPEGIITHGMDGFLVPIGDATEMSRHLLRLLEDRPLNETMGRAARRTVQARFSERVTSEIFLETYRELLSEQRVAEEPILLSA